MSLKTDGNRGRTWLALLALTLMGLAGCSVSPPKGVKPVTSFDIERYLGTWYEIARLDHSFERGLDNVKAEYSQRADGHVQVVNSGYDSKTGERDEAVGVAKFIGDKSVGSLKVSFFGPFYGGYHIIELDEDYQWALVAGPNRNYLWILARDRQIPDDVRARFLDKAEALGFEVAELIWVEHDRADM